MGIPVFISDSSSDTTDLASIVFTSGITSSYDEYMFVFTDINPVTDSADWTFQVNADGESGYNEIITSTSFSAHGYASGSGSSMNYQTAEDQANGTALQVLGDNVGNGADESLGGILNLYTPSNTTYVTHFISRLVYHGSDDSAKDSNVAGYFNITAAITDVQFKFSSGNFDGLIQMFGIR